MRCEVDMQGCKVVVKGSPLRALRQASLAGLLVAMTILQSACLSPTFTVSRDEMERLAKVEPSQRGRQIHAVQRFSTAPDVPAAPPFEPGPQQLASDGSTPPVPVAVPVPIGPHYSYYGGYGWGDPFYTPYYVRSGGGGAVGGAGVAGSSAGPADHGGVSEAAKAVASKGKADRESLAGAAAAIMVTAIVVGIGLAATEGARHDGYVAVHPHHPVHLLSSDGSHRILALDDVRPGDLRTDETAVLVGQEGMGLWLRGRAPLDREGFTYQLGGGYTGVSLGGGTMQPAGMGELALGVFLNQMVGVVARGQFGSGTLGMGDYLTLRTGAEAQLIPLDLGRLHMGLYGGAGMEWAKAGGGEFAEFSEKRPYYALGGLIEIEWTTRLAMFFRYGANLAQSSSAAMWTQAGAFGLSIY